MVFIVLTFVATLAGCGSGGGGLSKNDDNLRRIGVYYGRFLAQTKGTPPKNEGQFKEFIKKIDPEVDTEKIFVSPRDHEPYVVKYNLKGAGGMDPTKGAPIVAHEKVGVAGKVQVARSTGQFDEVDVGSIK